MEDVKCLICLETASVPRMCPKCSKFFCASCISNIYGHTSEAMVDRLDAIQTHWENRPAQLSPQQSEPLPRPPRGLSLQPPPLRPPRQDQTYLPPLTPSQQDQTYVPLPIPSQQQPSRHQPSRHQPPPRPSQTTKPSHMRSQPCPHCRTSLALSDYIKADFVETLANSLKEKDEQLRLAEKKLSSKMAIADACAKHPNEPKLLFCGQRKTSICRQGRRETEVRGVREGGSGG